MDTVIYLVEAGSQVNVTDEVRGYMNWGRGRQEFHDPHDHLFLLPIPISIGWLDSLDDCSLCWKDPDCPVSH